MLEEAFEILDRFGFAECTSAHANLIRFLGRNHEQVREPSVFAEVTLPIIEKI